MLFRSNYHYIVPEAEDSTQIRLTGNKLWAEYAEAKELGIETKPVITGVYTLFKLCRFTGKKRADDFINAFIEAYKDVYSKCEAVGIQWLQFDEPALVQDMTEEDRELFVKMYSDILGKKKSCKVLLQTYFGDVRDVYKLIRYCQLEKGMVIIHGDAGIGKTKGAERFVRENPTASVYIQATPSTGTLGNLLKVLARALKVPETRSKLDLTLAIREKLEGTNKVIIIDEAQHLQLRSLEEIRTWADANPITGQQGVGIALIGNTEVYTRMVGKQEARFAQLFSRIRMNRYYSTRKVTDEDVAKLFPKLAEDGRKKELNFLHGISQSKWGIRGAVNVYNNAVNNENISYDGLYAMARTMGIGLV